MLKLVLWTICINAFVDGQTCTCNLNIGLCDVNCCCDTDDCSTSDISTFSFCQETLSNSDNLLCTYDQIVYVNNIAVTQTIRQNGLFCIELDNFASRNFYINPQCISSGTCFDGLSQSFQYNITSLVTTTSETSYRSGDVIYVIYNVNAQSEFSLPTSGISSTCQDNNPVKYLENSAVSCTRVLSPFDSTTCQMDAFQYTTYFENFKIVPSPSFINSSGTNSPMFNETGLVSISFGTCSLDGVSINCNLLNSTIFNSTALQCSNVVSSVTYVIETNATFGINSAQVFLALSTITAADLPLTQTFAVRFQPASTSATTRQLSGNPGYLVGKPLLSAVRTGSSVISSNTNPNVGVTIINPDSSGLCTSSAAQSRLSVLFGQDRVTGCKVQLASWTCVQLQQIIFSALDGQTFNQNGSLYVGAFGNSDLNNLLQNPPGSDWLLVMNGTPSALNSPSNQTTGCMNMILSSKYEILFANSGAISNPQAKIVGVRYTYGNQQFLPFRCLGGDCNSATNGQSVEISTSVVFIDVSETPVSLETQRPTIEVRLPNDFFFPFRSAANTRFYLSASCLTLLMLISFLCIM